MFYVSQETKIKDKMFVGLCDCGEHCLPEEIALVGRQAYLQRTIKKFLYPKGHKFFSIIKFIL